MAVKSFQSLLTEDELLEKIHKQRMEIAAARQPRHQGIWTRLDDVLRDIGKMHPYSLCDEHYDVLLKEDKFAVGGYGLSAALPGVEYLYRVNGVNKLRTYSKGWRDRGEEGISDTELFGIMIDEAAKTGGWLKLTSYAQGDFCNPRKMSWWTSLELPPNQPEKIVQGLSHCGIPSNWMTRYSVVMRCKPANLRMGDFLHVPTVIDAFDLEIFHPTCDAHRPECGVAIYLQNAGALQEGTQEFVLQPIRVEEIEIFPVEITDQLKDTMGVPLNVLLHHSLLDYYMNF
jgi:hypothetical protein